MTRDQLKQEIGLEKAQCCKNCLYSTVKNIPVLGNQLCCMEYADIVDDHIFLVLSTNVCNNFKNK